MPKAGLVVSAHPGDFVWRAGGAIALHAKRGFRVKIIAWRSASAANPSSPGSSRA
jgi:LmbE family N-acetylglucosaminyl deacetylase